MNGKQVLKQLKAASWNVVRIKGSHHVIHKDVNYVRRPFMARPISPAGHSPRLPGSPG
jgi:predicted RNA binding protein YcfA (HicA-like mRNA interferase family)